MIRLIAGCALLCVAVGGCALAPTSEALQSASHSLHRVVNRAGALAASTGSREHLYVGANCGAYQPNVTIIPLPLVAHPREIVVPISARARCVDESAVRDDRAFFGTSLSDVQAYRTPLNRRSHPIYQLGNGIQRWGVAFDGRGDLFVADDDSWQIDVYQPPITHKSVPAIVFGGSSVMQYERSLVFDQNGDLFMANTPFHNVLIYQPPFTDTSMPAVTISPPNGDFAAAVTLDPAGNLYVAGGGLSNVIYVYAPPFSNSSTPFLTIGGQQSQLNAPQSLATDAQGDLYVSNGFGGTLLEFVPPFSANSAPAVTVSGLSPGGVNVF